jgi:response regulator RpfG family c-di-GMP phosphodiesterase
MAVSDRKIWVLIIDDNKVTRKLSAHQLHKNEFQVICAETGEEAMEILKYCTPDCILLDVLMPKMHGYEFLSLLRDGNKSLPVMVMSAIENQPDLVYTMEKLGIQGWFSKSVDFTEIAKRINEVVKPEPKT